MLLLSSLYCVYVCQFDSSKVTYEDDGGSFFPRGLEHRPDELLALPYVLGRERRRRYAEQGALSLGGERLHLKSDHIIILISNAIEMSELDSLGN